MTVRKRREIETLDHLHWLTKQKDVDWATLDYPTADKVAVVDGADRPMLFAHFHAGLIIESLAFRPGLSPKEKLESALEVVNNQCSAAKGIGVREAYYMSSDARTDESAMRHLGFEKVTMYRKRL